MQALWSDYGDVIEQLYSPGDPDYDPDHPENNYRLLRELHNGDAPAGAWLDNWSDCVPSGGAQWVGLQVETFDYSRVQWRNTAYNSPYDCWPKPEEDPETWDFYKIRPNCHAYTQVSGIAELNALFEKATTWRLDYPMFVATADWFHGGQYNREYDRYKNNTVVVMLEIAYYKSTTQSGGTSDWKYNYLHFLVPPIDVPVSESLDDEYDLLSYGQNLVALCPAVSPSNEHKIQWIRMHVYNLGALTLYCPGLTLWVES